MDLLVFDNSGASCAVLMLVLPGSSTTASAKCNRCPTDGATHDRMFSCQTSISVALLMCCYQDLSPNIASMINDHKDAAETTVAVRHLLETCTQRQRQPQPQRQESLQWLAVACSGLHVCRCVSSTRSAKGHQDSHVTQGWCNVQSSQDEHGEDKPGK